MTENRPLTRREMRERERAEAARQEAEGQGTVAGEDAPPAQEAPVPAQAPAPAEPPAPSAASPEQQSAQSAPSPEESTPEPAAAPERTSLAERMASKEPSRPLSRRELRARTIASTPDDAPTGVREALRRPVQEPTTTTGISVVDPTGAVTAVNIPITPEAGDVPAYVPEAEPALAAEPPAAPEPEAAPEPVAPEPEVAKGGEAAAVAGDGPATEAMDAVADPEPPQSFDELFTGLEEDVESSAAPARKSVFPSARAGEEDAAVALAGQDPERRPRGWGALPYLVQLLIVIVSMFIVGVVIWLVLDRPIADPAAALGPITIEGFL